MIHNTAQSFFTKVVRMVEMSISWDGHPNQSEGKRLLKLIKVEPLDPGKIGKSCGGIETESPYLKSTGEDGHPSSLRVVRTCHAICRYGDLTHVLTLDYGLAWHS